MSPDNPEEMVDPTRFLTEHRGIPEGFVGEHSVTRNEDGTYTHNFTVDTPWMLGRLDVLRAELQFHYAFLYEKGLVEEFWNWRSGNAE